MKATDNDPTFWHVSDLDDGGWPKFIAAGAVLTMWLIVLYLAYLTLWAAS